MITQLWLVWYMLILLDVILNVWAEPVIFYGNDLFTTYCNKVFYNLYQVPKASYAYSSSC